MATRRNDAPRVQIECDGRFSRDPAYEVAFPLRQGYNGAPLKCH
jgi:hypothetical protein